MPERVLVTGGTGFVGWWMQQTQPKDIAAVYMNREQYEKETLWKYDYFVHLAPTSPARILKHAEMYHNRVMFASSGAVYEKQDNYAYNKRLWEAQCKHSEAYVVIARLFCFVGAHMPEAFDDGKTPSILQFIREGIKGGPIHYYDVGYIRSYMYGEDLGHWMWKILLDGEGVYDVGSSLPVSMRQVAHAVANVCKCETVEDLVPEQKPLMYLPDTMRARELGCVETVGLHDAIERTVEYECLRLHS
jgi:nucleoside-diphosphate-sugar epimerase